MAIKYIYGRAEDGYRLISAAKNTQKYFNDYELSFYCTYPRYSRGDVYFFRPDRERNYLVFGRNFTIEEKGRRETRSVLIFTMDEEEIKYCLQNTANLFLSRQEGALDLLSDTLPDNGDINLMNTYGNSYYSTYFIYHYYSLNAPAFIEAFVSAIINRRTLYVKAFPVPEAEYLPALTAISAVIKVLPVSLRNKASFIVNSDTESYYLYNVMLLSKDANLEDDYVFDSTHEQTKPPIWAEYMADTFLYNMSASLKSRFYTDNRNLLTIKDIEEFYTECLEYRKLLPQITQAPGRMEIIAKKPELYKTILAQYLEYNIYEEHKDFLEALYSRVLKHSEEANHGNSPRDMDLIDYLLSKKLSEEDFLFFLRLYSMDKSDILNHGVEQLEKSGSKAELMLSFYFYSKTVCNIFTELQLSYLEAVLIKILKNNYNTVLNDLDDYDFADIAVL